MGRGVEDEELLTDVQAGTRSLARGARPAAMPFSDRMIRRGTGASRRSRLGISSASAITPYTRRVAKVVRSSGRRDVRAVRSLPPRRRGSNRRRIARPDAAPKPYNVQTTTPRPSCRRPLPSAPPALTTSKGGGSAAGRRRPQRGPPPPVSLDSWRGDYSGNRTAARKATAARRYEECLPSRRPSADSRLPVRPLRLGHHRRCAVGGGEERSFHHWGNLSRFGPIRRVRPQLVEFA